MHTFQREVLGILTFPDEHELKLRACAEEYIDRTEAYDLTVCTGPVVRGSIMPATGHEQSLIARNARSVMACICQRENIDSAELRRAVADYHEREYVPMRTPQTSG